MPHPGRCRSLLGASVHSDFCLSTPSLGTAPGCTRADQGHRLHKPKRTAVFHSLVSNLIGPHCPVNQLMTCWSRLVEGPLTGALVLGKGCLEDESSVCSSYVSQCGSLAEAPRILVYVESGRITGPGRKLEGVILSVFVCLLMGTAVYVERAGVTCLDFQGDCMVEQRHHSPF